MTDAPNGLYDHIRTAVRELDTPTVESITEYIAERDLMTTSQLRGLVEDAVGGDPVDVERIAGLSNDEFNARLADKWPQS